MIDLSNSVPAIQIASSWANYPTHLQNMKLTFITLTVLLSLPSTILGQNDNSTIELVDSDCVTGGGRMHGGDCSKSVGKHACGDHVIVRQPNEPLFFR